MNEPKLRKTPCRLPEAASPAYTRSPDARGEPVRPTAAEPPSGPGRRSREGLSRADRYVVTMLATLLGSTVLGFVALGGQLLRMQQQIGGIQQQIGGIQQQIRGMQEQIHGMQRDIRALSERVDHLEERMTRVEERMTRVEERMTRVEERMTGVEKVLRNQRGPLPPP